MRKVICMVIFVFVVVGIGSAAMALNGTDYRQQEDCSLCGKQESSITSLYSNVNGVGLLNFNDFTINTLRICKEEPNMSGSSRTMNVSGEDGSIISIDSNLKRRIANIEIFLRGGSKPNQKEMSKFLCTDCCKRIEQENKYDVAFMDYQTREIFPIEENVIEFYIGNYAIHRLNTGDSLEYLIFHAPEQ